MVYYCFKLQTKNLVQIHNVYLYTYIIHWQCFLYKYLVWSPTNKYD